MFPMFFYLLFVCEGEGLWVVFSLVRLFLQGHGHGFAYGCCELSAGWGQG